METYIFLSIEDKKKLQYLAQIKQLSLSTCAGIIINNLAIVVNDFYKTYINKGEKQIHIKVKTKEYTKNIINSMVATNCIYCYLHKPKYNGQKINWCNKTIQAELDRTEDKNADKYIRMKLKYVLEREQQL